MKRMLHSVAIAAILTLSALSIGSAHLISVEHQATYRIPMRAPAEADFSFEHPFIVTRLEQGHYVGPEESQAVFGFLTRRDVDVYQVDVLPSDLPVPGPDYKPLIISASALPPACRQTVNNYPVTALLMPSGPAPQLPPNMTLPFDVPDGYDVIVAPNENAGFREKRPIFDIDEADPELGLGISWFLPIGLSMDCLFNNPMECDYSNTISQPVFAPGTYFIVIWDPTGKPQDYTANIGFAEEVSSVVDQTEMQELVSGNALLHTFCRDPYQQYRCR